MMKNRIATITKAPVLAIIMVMAFVGVLIGASNGLAAEQAAIAAKVPLKSSPSLLGGKVVRQLEPGILVNVLSTKGNFKQVELVDDPSVKGWVPSPAISTNKDIVGGVANMNSASQGVADTKTKVAGSIGGVAKGFSDLSPAAQAAATAGKGKAVSLKEGIGAVARGKQQALEDEGKEALSDAVGGDVGDVMNAAAETAGKFKGKSASTLEKIEALKISDSEISGFMKEGGLRSRLIRQ